MSDHICEPASVAEIDSIIAELMRDPGGELLVRDDSGHTRVAGSSVPNPNGGWGRFVKGANNRAQAEEMWARRELQPIIEQSKLAGDVFAPEGERMPLHEAVQRALRAHYMGGQDDQ